MQTMHLTLPVGAFDWQENPLSEPEFQKRVAKLRTVMSEKGWGGVLVFGEIHECGLLTYYSNYAPRLSPALTLIPLTGELRVLTLVGGRMVPAGKLTTWIEDVRPAGDLSKSLGEWFAENSTSGPMAIAGFDLMQAGDYAPIAKMTEIITAEDATSTLEQLARAKSAAEISIIKDNCSILNKVTIAVTESQRSGDSPASSAVVAEKTARNLGAQDARCLYSSDGGRSFRPFQNLSDERADPVVLYVAIKLRGYWVDGFITIGEQQSEASKDALMGMVAAAMPGISFDELNQIQNKHLIGFRSHPLLLESIGSGIGVSLEEKPHFKADYSDKMEEGDVISLKVGIQDENNVGFASALLHIHSSGNEILWTSA